jgi:hypothetical protein
MKAYMLRRWRRASSPEPIPFFTCARPGRTSDEKSKKAMVEDKTVDKWIAGIADAPKTAIVSLLGHKPPPSRMSEFAFYSFHGEADTEPERAKRLSFQEWLSSRHPTRCIQVVEHPTEDYAPVPDATCAAVQATVDRLLADGWRVVLIDSGGEVRVKQVCRSIGFVEDSRSL